MGGKCEARLDPNYGLEIECPTCSGGDEKCEACEGKGRYEVNRCPFDYAQDCIELGRLSGLWENGIPPVAGGVMDQAAWFVNANSLLGSEKHRIASKETAKRGKS